MRNWLFAWISMDILVPCVLSRQLSACMIQQRSEFLFSSWKSPYCSCQKYESGIIKGKDSFTIGIYKYNLLFLARKSMFGKSSLPFIAKVFFLCRSTKSCCCNYLGVLYFILQYINIIVLILGCKIVLLKYLSTGCYVFVNVFVNICANLIV